MKSHERKTNLTDRQWKRLIRDIKEQRCILMLGPKIQGIKQNDKWFPLNEIYSNSLTKEIEDSGLEFEKESANNLSYISQRFLNIPDVLRIDLEDDARDFYSSHTKEIPPIYKKISQLPFHLVINTTLDNFMERAFNEEGKSCQAYYYNFKRHVKNRIYPEKINPNYPLVYNLFGTFQQSESMVLTEQNQLEFVRNVVQSNPGIPEEILEQFDTSKSYLFIGFDLEHWQFRLVLESLNIKEGNTTLAPKSPNYSLRNITKSFFQDHFRFNFIDQNVNELFEELNERLEKGKTIEIEGHEKLAQTRKVFLAFCDEDEKICNRLETTLQPLEQNNKILISHRGKITPGDDVPLYIESKLDEADVILLLLSADFLADDQIRNRELEIALSKNKNKSAKVLPIVGRYCDWQSNSELNELIPMLDGGPLLGNKILDEDDAYFQIVEELKKRIF